MGYLKTFTTNALDRAESSRRPRLRRLAEFVGSFVPRDWSNYFS